MPLTDQPVAPVRPASKRLAASLAVTAAAMAPELIAATPAAEKAAAPTGAAVEMAAPRAASKPRGPRPAALAADLRVTIMRTARVLRSQRQLNNVSESQFSVLVFLHKYGAKTPRELAEHERVQPPSMTRTVNALAQAGLVQRCEHPSDRRQVVISLTDAGIAEVKETRRRREAWLSRQLATLTPEERETMALASDILRRLTLQ